MDRQRIKKIAIRVWLVLLPFEIGASLLAYETMGEFALALALAATVVINLWAVIIYLMSAVPGLALALTFGLLIVGYQAHLGVRLLIVGLEAKRIVAWAYSEKEKTGSFPTDLAGYEFRFTSFEMYIRYRSDGQESLELYYPAGTIGSIHHYDTERGGWGYYPD